MAKVKVALNGHGSIGKRIADTVFITQDLGAIRINPIFITKLMLENPLSLSSHHVSGVNTSKFYTIINPNKFNYSYNGIGE